MENYAIIGLVLVGFFAIAVYLQRLGTRQRDMGEAAMQIVESLQKESELPTTSERLADLETRLDRIELSSEAVKEQALRHLQMASQRLRRAEAQDDNLEEEDALPVTIPIEQATEETAQNGEQEVLDLNALGEIIRNQGGNPL